MADTAAHLVDCVIPAVPVRQWVLSLPYALRFRAAFDSELMGELLGIFIHEVFTSLRKRAKDIDTRRRPRSIGTSVPSCCTPAARH